MRLEAFFADYARQRGKKFKPLGRVGPKKARKLVEQGVGGIPEDAASRAALSGMTLEVPLSIQPMEAIPVDDLPTGNGWLFEPKYDGFRCILFREAVR